MPPTTCPMCKGEIYSPGLEECPHCGEETNIFDSGGGQSMAEKMHIPFLGKIPLDPRIVAAGDSGTPYTQAVAESPAKEALEDITKEITSDY